MFDDKFIYEYKAVKAPKELKSRILKRVNSDEAKKKTKMLYRYPRYMAFSVICAFVIFCGFISIKYFYSLPNISIINDYDVKAKNMINTCNADMMQKISIRIETDYEMTIRVNKGSLHVISADGEEVVCDSYKGKGEIIVQWVVDLEQIESSEMSITSFLKNYTYTLYETNGEIKIKKCKNN